MKFEDSIANFNWQKNIYLSLISFNTYIIGRCDSLRETVFFRYKNDDTKLDTKSMQFDNWIRFD